MSELKVGQTVYIRDVNEYPSIKEGIKPPPTGTITKIGRKLFTVDDGAWEKQYRLEDRTSNDHYGHSSIQTFEEFEESKARESALKRLLDAGVQFDWTSKKHLSVSALEQIADIVEADG